MKRTRALIIVGIAAAIAVALWWKHRAQSVPSAVPKPVAVEKAAPAPAAKPVEQGSADVPFVPANVKDGRPLSGTVTDATGGAVAGAHIEAGEARAMTGADGKYTMLVKEGTLLVAASSPDYAPQARYVVVGASGATADFSLVPGGVIEGIVRDEKTREPVGGANVVTTRHHVTAGADGRFRITGLKPGAYELDAFTSGRHSKKPTIVGLGVAEQVADVEILVGAGPVVRGIAIDENGAPAEGVKVSTFRGDEAQAPTDAKGAFVIEGLAPGRYMVMGSGNGFVPAGGAPFELANKDVDGVKVTVRRGVKVRGHVEPRQVCEVRLDFDDKTLGPREMPMLVSPTTTDGNGDFELPPASPLPYVIAARCPSGDQGSEKVTLAPNMADVTVHVAPGASIAGRVVDGSGKPVAAVTVMAAPRSGTERTVIVNGLVTSGAQVITGADGKFELKGLSAATYHVSVLDRGKPLPMKNDVTLALGATDHKTGVELSVERPDGTISGTVVGADGAPIADAWVSVHQDFEDLLGGMGSGSESRMITVQETDDGSGPDRDFAPVLTDASGHFEIRGLPKTPWTVVAEAQHGALRGRQTKVTPDATVTVKALGVTSLSGVVHGVTGVFSVELDGPTHQQRSFASADGSFSFARVDPGSYDVHVTSSAGNGDARVQVTPGQAATVEITLASNAIVTGAVVDAQGKPVAGAGVAVVPDSPDGHVRISLEGPPPMTNADGTFRLEAKAGPSALAVLTQPRPTIKRGLSLVAGQTTDVGAIKVDAAP